jgi:Tn3 transposase DDE domain
MPTCEKGVPVTSTQRIVGSLSGTRRGIFVSGFVNYRVVMKKSSRKTRPRSVVKTLPPFQHWDDLLRIAGSLKMGAVRASELIRSLQRGGRGSTLGRAIGELGRIPKTLQLLNFIADSNYRRHILNQLNRGEGRGRLARGECFTASVENCGNATERVKRTS